jgi:hypothetical protein
MYAIVFEGIAWLPKKLELMQHLNVCIRFRVKVGGVSFPLP